MIGFMKIIIDKNNSHSNNKQTLREKTLIIFKLKSLPCLNIVSIRTKKGICL